MLWGERRGRGNFVAAISRFLDAGHTDYPVPTTAEIRSIEIHHLQTRTGASGTGAKGVGEGGTVGSAAVLNAVGRAGRCSFTAIAVGTPITGRSPASGPTERGVRISRTTLFGRCFTAFAVFAQVSFPWSADLLIE
jgi:hypothetical protein